MAEVRRPNAVKDDYNAAGKGTSFARLRQVKPSAPLSAFSSKPMDAKRNGRSPPKGSRHFMHAMMILLHSESMGRQGGGKLVSAGIVGTPHEIQVFRDGRLERRGQ